MFWNKKDKRIYLDHAASTPVDPRVERAMEPYFGKYFGNPGSLHLEGVLGKEVVEDARARIAKLLNAHSDEFFFTSGGTESNNLAIFGSIETIVKGGKDYGDLHAITSVIEHPSVLECFKELEGRGVAVTYLSVEESGLIDPKTLRKSLQLNTALVSIMYVNNEIGTIEPIADLKKAIRSYQKAQKMVQPQIFHIDASQAAYYLTLDTQKLGVDLLTLDGQKLCGPKGIGVLYKRRGVEINPLFVGGSQESGLRPGTENVPLIVGLAQAFEIANEERERNSKHVTALRDYFTERLLKEIPRATLNGDRARRIANNVNISIPGIDGTYFVLLLDQKGIACGTRSACMGEDDEASYVLRALGKGDREARGSLRFSIGVETSRRDIDYTVQTLRELVSKFDEA